MSMPAAPPSEDLEPRAERLLTRLTFAIGVLVIGLLVRRLPYGVDVTDESFYIAMPYRFLMGARPFVDEALLHQTAALLTYPLVAAYVEWSGGTDGIVLFMRSAYLVFSLCFSAVVAFVFAKFVRPQYAVLIGLAGAAFVPFCIPSFSYNTLGISFFTCGVLLGSFSLIAPSAKAAPAVGGAFLGLTTLAYPPLGLPASAHVLATVAATRKSGRTAALLYAGCALLVALCAAAFLASFGVDNIASAIATTAALGSKGGGLEKLAVLASEVFYWVLLQPAPLVIAVLLWRGTRETTSPYLKWLPGLALVMPLALDGVDYWMHSARGLFQVLHFALAAPLLLQLGALSDTEKRFCSLVFLASAVAAPLMAYTSANGLMNAGVGMLPAAFISVFALVRAVEHTFGDRDGGIASALLPAVPAVLFLFILLSTYSTTTYSAKTPKTTHLTHHIKSGPFAGMYTFPNRGVVIESMQTDLDAHATAADTILFFDDLPAGYLMTDAVSLAASAWTPHVRGSPQTPRVVLKYFERQGKQPSLLMYRGQNQPVPNHPLLNWANSEYEIIVRRPGHVLYRARRS